MRQTVVSLVPTGGSLFEIATPSGIWGRDRSQMAGLDIDFIAAGLESTTVELAGGVAMSKLALLQDCLPSADMLVIPTWPVATAPIPERLVESLSDAHGNGTRLVGLCLGAFVVAATGLLDGSSAVTHWRHRDRFEAAYPNVSFEPNTLYVDHGQVVTSAGSAAATDCCLHLVRRDHGAEPAAAIARSLVTAPHRSGTQSQFASAPPIPRGPDPLALALGQAAEDIAAVPTVGALAALATVSRRSLERQMRDRLGVSPKEWIDEQRVFTACRLLEQPELSIERVAALSGYGSTPSLRRAFHTHRGTTPTRYRAMFMPVDASAGTTT